MRYGGAVFVRDASDSLRAARGGTTARRHGVARSGLAYVLAVGPARPHVTLDTAVHRGG